MAENCLALSDWFWKLEQIFNRFIPKWSSYDQNWRRYGHLKFEYFIEINRKNLKAYRRKRVNKWWNIWKITLKCDFIHVFAISTTSSIGKPDSDQFPQDSFKICLTRRRDTGSRKYRIWLKFQYLKKGWKLRCFDAIF